VDYFVRVVNERERGIGIVATVMAIEDGILKTKIGLGGWNAGVGAKEFHQHHELSQNCIAQHRWVSVKNDGSKSWNTLKGAVINHPNDEFLCSITIEKNKIVKVDI